MNARTNAPTNAPPNAPTNAPTNAASSGAPFAGVDAAAIEQALRAALAPLELVVQDDSHLHAGHAGAREGRHFSVRVVSERFNGLSRLARHRLVYDSLAALIPRGIHALAIDARAPGDA